MEVFKIWNKRVTKLTKMMFNQKIHHDYQNVNNMQITNSNYPHGTSTSSPIFDVLTFSLISLNGFLSLTTSLPELFVS